MDRKKERYKERIEGMNEIAEYKQKKAENRRK